MIIELLNIIYHADKTYFFTIVIKNILMILLPISQDVQMEDIYEALIQTKDDKITFLISLITIILAFFSIITAILIASFSWAWSKIRKQINTTKELINKLKKKEKEIIKKQEDINKFLNSVNFEKHLERIKRTAEEINYDFHIKDEEWKEEEHFDINEMLNPDEKEIRNLFENLFRKYDVFKSKQLIEKFESEADKKLYEKVGKYVEKQRNAKIRISSTKELKEFNNMIDRLIEKYFS